MQIEFTFFKVPVVKVIQFQVFWKINAEINECDIGYTPVRQSLSKLQCIPGFMTIVKSLATQVVACL